MNGICVWNYFLPVGVCIYFGEFGAEIEYDSRIINPDKNYNDGAGSAIDRSNVVTSEIKPDGEFAKHEKKGGEGCPCDAIT